MTDQLGQSQVIPYLRGLSAKGFAIHLVSFEKKRAFQMYSKEISEILSESNITWVPVKYTSKPPVISTVYDIMRLKKTAGRLNKKLHFSIVHCRSYIAAFGGLALKRKGVKFVFDMRGFWADERVDGKIWNTNNFLYRHIYKYFKKKEKVFFEEADYIISLTRAGKKIISEKNDLCDRIEVIPCCADLDLFNVSNISMIQRSSLKESIGIGKDDFVLSYLGSVGTWYMLPEMMQFYKCLLEVKPEAKFLFITKDDPAIIYEEAAKLGLEKTGIIIKGANRMEVPVLLSVSNCSVFFILPVFSKKASSPTKFGEIAGMGIPVVCNAGVGDIDDFMSDENMGVLIRDFSIEEMKRAAGIIAKKNYNPEIVINTAKNNFSLDKGVDLYESVYRKLII